MKLIPCDEKDATHVQVLSDGINVTPYAIYPIWDSDGDEMIKTDDGLFAESFSLVIPVRWLREVPS